jgi:hypothetical protein
VTQHLRAAVLLPEPRTYDLPVEYELNYPIMIGAPEVWPLGAAAPRQFLSGHGRGLIRDAENVTARHGSGGLAGLGRHTGTDDSQSDSAGLSGSCQVRLRAQTELSAPGLSLPSELILLVCCICKPRHDNVIM